MKINLDDYILDEASKALRTEMYVRAGYDAPVTEWDEIESDARDMYRGLVMAVTTVLEANL